jgi:hypothetical protein
MEKLLLTCEIDRSIFSFLKDKNLSRNVFSLSSRLLSPMKLFVARRNVNRTGREQTQIDLLNY